MLITVDPGSPVPIYAQVAAAVRRQIADGTIVAGERLPPARHLAEALGVNLHTVLRGYQELRDEGVLEVRRGRGAVVTPLGEQRAGLHAALAHFVAEARRAGLAPDDAAGLVREGMSS